MTKEIKSFCTNDEAREHFIECGLNYNNITEGDILTLVLMLNKELKISNEKRETSVSTIRLSPKIDINTNEDGSIKWCYLYMNSHYFTEREAISFNRDGFIGFAGWADSSNLNPIKKAFWKWCDSLKDER